MRVLKVVGLVIFPAPWRRSSRSDLSPARLKSQGGDDGSGLVLAVRAIAREV
jgi:hypothetical protein